MYPSDDAWRERILQVGARMVGPDEAETEIEKDSDLCSCADPSDYFCRATGVIEATFILFPKDVAMKIIVLGLP